MNIYELLFETASEEAKRLGLQHHGWNLWKNSSGIVVAKTEGDKLVFLSKNQQYNPSDKDVAAGASQPHPEEIEAGQADHLEKQEKEREKQQKKKEADAKKKKVASKTTSPKNPTQAVPLTPKAGGGPPLDRPESILSPNDVALIQRINGTTPQRRIPSSWSTEYFKQMYDSPHIKPYLKGAEKLHKRFGGDVNAIGDWVETMRANLKSSDSYRNMQLGKEDKNSYKIDRLLTTLTRLERASILIGAKEEYDEYQNHMKASNTPSFAKISPQSDSEKAANLKLLTPQDVSLWSPDTDTNYFSGKNAATRKYIENTFQDVDISDNKSLKILQFKLKLQKTLHVVPDGFIETIDSWIDNPDSRYDDDPDVYTDIKIRAYQKKHYTKIVPEHELTPRQTSEIYQHIRSGLKSDRSISDDLRARVDATVQTEIQRAEFEIEQEILDSKYENKFGTREQKEQYITGLKQKLSKQDWFPQNITVSDTQPLIIYEDGSTVEPAGTYHKETGEIAIYPRAFEVALKNGYEGEALDRFFTNILSHELQHHYNTVLFNGVKDMLKKIREDRDNTLLTSPGFAEEHFSELTFFNTVRKYSEQIHAQGEKVSWYAKKFWDRLDKNRPYTFQGANYNTAIDETIAEMVSYCVQKHGNARPSTVKKEFAKKKTEHIWTLYAAAHWYKTKHKVKHGGKKKTK